MGGGGASASLADPSAAMASYQKGADVIEQQFPKALNYMQGALGQGWRDTVTGFTESLKAGQPFSQTATDALDEMRGMLGMAPVSKVGQLTSQLEAMTKKFSVSSELWKGLLPGKFQQFQNDAGLIDSMPTGEQRSQAINTLKANLTDLYQKKLSETNGARIYADAVQRVADDYGISAINFRSTQLAGDNRAHYDPGLVAKSATRNTAGAAQAIADLNTLGDQLIEQYGAEDNVIDALGRQSLASFPDYRNFQHAMQEILPELNNTIQDIDKYLPETPKAAPTAAEVQAKLESLPEYQNQFNQGTKALERSQAARGILQSGNAVGESIQFGQDLAQNVYSRHMGNLSQLMGATTPFVSQAQNLYTGLGGAGNQANTAIGGATYQNMTDIARSRESAFIKSGDAQLQTELLNAQLKTQASMQNSASKSAGMAGMGQLAGSLLGMFL